MRYNNPDDLVQALEQQGYERKENEEVNKFLDRCLWDLYVNKNFSLRDLERRLPCSYWVFYTHLHAMGAPMRPRGGANNFKHGRRARSRKER